MSIQVGDPLPDVNRRAERPIPRRRELILNQIPKHYCFAAAHQIRGEIRAEARNEDERATRYDSGPG